MGAHLNAYTSREQTVYYAKAFSKDLPQGRVQYSSVEELLSWTSMCFHHMVYTFTLLYSIIYMYIFIYMLCFHCILDILIILCLCLVIFILFFRYSCLKCSCSPSTSEWNKHFSHYKIQIINKETLKCSSYTTSADTDHVSLYEGALCLTLVACQH